MPTSRAAIAISLLIAGGAAHAQQHAASPYAGEERRQIASLSKNDLAELRSGHGWGLALPAELNGVPGPTHLLEMSKCLSEDFLNQRYRLVDLALRVGNLL